MEANIVSTNEAHFDLDRWSDDGGQPGPGDPYGAGVAVADLEAQQAHVETGTTELRICTVSVKGDQRCTNSTERRPPCTSPSHSPVSTG